MLSKEHKELLKRLKLEYIKKTAPGFFDLSGGHSMQIKPYDDRSANGLTNCISDFVKHLGGYCNRINTVGMVRKIHGRMVFTPGNGNKGAADLRILFGGRSFDVEVKIKDRQSEAQKKEQQRIQAAGGIYVVCRSFEQFLNYWQEWSLTIPEFQPIQKTKAA